MKAAGIIAEYNPFHNGHAYQLREIRERTGADYVVIAMSGDYVQRGEPAILDKYARTQMALENGADLVLELPVGIATSSAEAFARGGVELLADTGVIDYLGFGAETDNLPLLMELAHILNEEPEGYRTALRQALSDGKSFPAARADALAKYISDYAKSGITMPNCSCKNTICENTTCENTINDSITHELFISDTLTRPNNILAIEYLKALEKINKPTNENTHSRSTCTAQITPILIPRIGDDYHAQDTKSKYASATAIRRILANSQACNLSSVTFNSSDKTNRYGASIYGSNQFISTHSLSSLQENLTNLANFLPLSCINILNNYASTTQFLNVNSLSELLGYRLLLLRSKGYEEFADISPELSSRIRKSVDFYQNFTQFTELLKTKELTYTRISRALLHIVLDIKKEYPTTTQPTETSPSPVVPYLRILGFRRDASPLLHEIKNRASLPVLTKIADAPSILDKDALTILRQEIFVSDLYRQLARRGDSVDSRVNEINHGLVIL